jgi:hypothetical protein
LPLAAPSALLHFSDGEPRRYSKLLAPIEINELVSRALLALYYAGWMGGYKEGIYPAPHH